MEEAICSFNKEHKRHVTGAKYVVEVLGFSKRYDVSREEWYRIYAVEYWGQKDLTFLPFIVGFMISCNIVTKDFSQVRINGRSPPELRKNSLISEEVIFYGSDTKEYILAIQKEGAVLRPNETFLVSVTQLVTEEQLDVLRKMVVSACNS